MGGSGNKSSVQTSYSLGLVQTLQSRQTPTGLLVHDQHSGNFEGVRDEDSAESKQSVCRFISRTLHAGDQPSEHGALSASVAAQAEGKHAVVKCFPQASVSNFRVANNLSFGRHYF